MGKVINGQLNAILSTDYKQALTGDVLTALNQMFGWVEKFEELKAKYQQFDLEKKLSQYNTEEVQEVNSDAMRYLVNLMKLGLSRV